MTTDNIIVIEDHPSNGKCCIFPNRHKISASNKSIDLKNIDHVIFNYNEELPHKQHLINEFIATKNLIKDKKNTIKFYNDPEVCFNIGNKFSTYEMLKHINNNLVRLPKYKLIKKIEDTKDVSFLPCIVKNCSDTIPADAIDPIANSVEELNKIVPNFILQEGTLCLEFIDSYVKQLQSYCSLRLLVINNILVDYHARPSKKWRIKTFDASANNIIQADNFFKLFIQDNKKDLQDYIDGFYDVFGRGFYVHDLILGQDNKLYFCESGIKFSMPVARRILNSKNLLQDKISMSDSKLINFYTRSMGI